MLKIYNTLTNQIETFKPIKPKRVNMYVCGPTVYSDIHIGNARPVIFFDIVKRYLTHLGYQVYYVSNITDVDDKIIDRAQALGMTEQALTKLYTDRFLDMQQTVGSFLPDFMPKATDYVTSMIEYIDELINKGYAYETKEGIYFRVLKVKDYGILSNQDIHQLNEGVRVDLDPDKENPRDFSLWKKTSDGLRFSSPWGDGRPGWHTECAVMNHDIFESEIDIHGGGSDLRFPHHENEIAQAQAHDHHHLAKYWMHVGRLDVDQVKMSKSLGNITLVKDMVKKYHPLAFRLFMIAHHYRQSINYSIEVMDEYAGIYDKIIRNLKKAFLSLSLEGFATAQPDQEIMDRFRAMMNDDFNTQNVITLIYDLIKQLNKTSGNEDKLVLYTTIEVILNILGIMPKFELQDEIIMTYKDWQSAREQKNFRLADELRVKLTEQGWL
ncbi:cysteine--tRNA ligase [Mycoplasmatota bacterium]|nr:cysteine--tRNA ligase [Mycoplasmatota bacterium]